MKSATLLVAVALLGASVFVHARPSQTGRNLQQVVYNPYVNEVKVSRLLDNRLPFDQTGGIQDAQKRQRATITQNEDGDITSAQLSATANYPDKVLDNPNGWRFKTVANSTMVIATPEDIKVRNTATANSKLAPAIALAGTNILTRGGVEGYTDVAAFGRPGLQYGATVAKADQYLQSLATDSFNTGDGFSSGASRARATAGQGITVAMARNVMRTNVGGIVSDVRSNANSGRWYMSPGTAVSGAANIGYSGRIYQFTQGRSRAELGTAEGGVLNWGISNGVSPLSVKLIPNNIYSEIDNKVNNDIGAANAGYLNIQKSYGGKENDSPENDVAATVRGRGAAEAGQINIAIAPNDDAEVLGDIKATSNQGPAVSGAFSLTNSYQTSEQGVDVNSRTSEYDAIAGNVGVSQAEARSVLANSATAKTTIGSALAYNIANAVVAKQNSATASADATTTTGQAAALSASQSLGGVHSDSQGAASATSGSQGNALSTGTALSGSIFTTRAVSTSAAAAKEGQAVSGSWSGALSADSTADTASSAATTTGNAASAAQGYSLGLLQGKATVASSSGTESGSAGSLGVGVATGVIQAQSKVASSAETKDGRAQSLAGALSVSGINAVASATSSGASETGDVTSNAQAAGLGAFHGEATATSSSGTGCVDCVSDSVANAVATGVVADALARSAADSDKNPGNALANAIAVGLISRTSNGGSARIAVGPGQAISGGFAVSAGNKAQQKVASAVNPESRKASVAAQTAEQGKA
eukprot:gene3102-3381_t